MASGLVVVSQPLASAPAISSPINASPSLLLAAPAANAEHFVSLSPPQAMASGGGMAALLRNKMFVSCVMLLVVLLMATQIAAAGGGARRLLWCGYRNCNCRTCPIYGWACCGMCCPP
ncbi:hypothetical protein CFC21_092042 [Triticum aestivum]|uniref:Uncharacterized protein n=2 Tax=Triticum aestivum TaxID=4565 RepID=A0A3B6QC51_WHEAT|nr:uncharacterized protein LOC123141309 [Triticum aestivum]KAF7088976.1 hypothetical protein CFC21_092042 [Triticum aestivum]